MRNREATRMVAVLAFVLTACASPTYMGRSSLVPAATGKVETHLGDNGNVKVEVEVEHLAPPSRLAPGAVVYSVWVTAKSPGAQAQNLGALVLDPNLKGRLETVTPLRAFTLSITPEADPAVAMPSGPVVLEQEIRVK